MSVNSGQVSQAGKIGEDYSGMQQSSQNQDQNQNNKHYNEFLTDSYDENDKKNHCTIGIAPDNLSVHESQGGDLAFEQEQQRHINELIDNYNSQMEFYKPQKGGSKAVKDIKNNSSQVKGDKGGNSSKINQEFSPLKQSNLQNQAQQKQQYQQQSQQYDDYEQRPIPLTAVLAEEKSKNQFISESGAANIQSFQNDDYEYCPNCNRKFFSGRLNLHLKSCKPNKPLKPVKKQSQQQNEDRDDQQNQQQLSPQKNNPSTVSFNKNNEYNNKSLTPSKREQQQQGYKQTNYQPSTQDNSDRDDTPNYQVSKYNIEQFEHKIQNQQMDEQAEDSRVQCDICGRKFMQDRIEKHQLACQKSQKARPVYNSSAARCPEDEAGQKLIPKTKLQPPKAAKKVSETSVIPLKGGVVNENHKKEDVANENSNIAMNSTISTQKNNILVQKPSQVAAKSNGGNSKKSGNEEKNKKIPKWKLEHQQFIENIRYNKMIKQVEKEGGDVSKIEKPVDDLEALGYVSCQYCQRKFAKETAERHIPLCKNIINRPKPPRQPSRQNSEKVNGSTNQNSENKKPGVRKIAAKNNFSVDDQESQMKSNISSYGDQQTNDNSDQTSLFSNKTLNTTGGAYNPPIQKNSSKVQSALYDKQNLDSNNQKSRTGLLPDLNIKQSDKKYFTSRKFGSYNNRNNNPNNSSNSEIQKQKLYEDVYSRVQQIQSVQCPHCERVFAKHASERHIPICKNIVNRPNPLNDITRNTRQSLPKKVSAQQAIYTQRQSLGHNQQSPRQQDPNKLLIDGQNYQKPRTSDSSSFSKIPNSLNSTKPSNFCGFCGFQFAMDHKYCGSCGKKRFSTAKKTISSNSQLGSKSNFDNSTLATNKTTNID